MTDVSKRCVVVAEFTPKPGHTQAIKDVLTAIIPEVHEEAGCEFYALHEMPDGKLCFVEAWDSRELWVAHSNFHTVERINHQIADHLAQPVDVHEMYAVPAGGEKGIIPLGA